MGQVLPLWEQTAVPTSPEQPLVGKEPWLVGVVTKSQDEGHLPEAGWDYPGPRGRQPHQEGTREKTRLEAEDGSSCLTVHAHPVP